ncbi:XRE family transcriptional regulator [Paracidovorax avenae]|uniref:helix-turn-helix domain-containing protein n=1 Tax=Paracidovorax avenae TaxID=80867 RepID=UPI000D166FB3|nr:helix-turn-helix transcriptional regulator [Paracidovorax avenae]AVS80329.1 XRE family transcriptional regulator [Paracidovorax avenae]AVT15567.1 XRE family transcriptional regulator [Paracidovorax avenae]
MVADPIERISSQVRAIRIANGWSQEELADRCGLHRTYIGAIERGERNITVLTLYKLAGALGCDVADLLDISIRKDAR